jgi:hypothetical protein
VVALPAAASLARSALPADAQALDGHVAGSHWRRAPAPHGRRAGSRRTFVAHPMRCCQETGEEMSSGGTTPGYRASDLLAFGGGAGCVRQTGFSVAACRRNPPAPGAAAVRLPRAGSRPPAPRPVGRHTSLSADHGRPGALGGTVRRRRARGLMDQGLPTVPGALAHRAPSPSDRQAGAWVAQLAPARSGAGPRPGCHRGLAGAGPRACRTEKSSGREAPVRGRRD